MDGTTSPDSDDLARLRRKVQLRIVNITMALIDRHTPTPPWDFQSIGRQLQNMGFRPTDHPEQTERELTAMLAFLDAWADLLTITENITWPDPDVNDDDVYG
jgi:hypothetical protein